ncbi:MAG: hypothetical protein K2M98_07865 [Muribaculum sp.]|nr:hypothetical protein [Muribaculum sp.]
MSSKKFIVLGVVGIILTILVYIALMGFPMKSFTVYGHTKNVLLAQLSNRGEMTFGLYAGQWIILLSYMATFVMLFLKNSTAYIAQCFSLLGAVVLAFALPTASEGAKIESSMGFGYWLILIISIAWTAYLYFASRPKAAK